MTPVRYRQLRGLLIHWRNRPQWLREPPAVREYTVGDRNTLLPGVRHGGRKVRQSNYRRIQLPTFGPLQGKGVLVEHRGRCRWCQLPITDARHSLWHQSCVPAYWAATGQQSALTAHLLAQFRSENADMSPPCDECNRCEHVLFNCVTDRYPNHETYLFYQRYKLPWKVEPRHASGDAKTMELDHRDALSIAWASGDERRLLRALTVDNLRFLCHDCHAVKTGDDRQRMNNLLNGRPEHYSPTARISKTTRTQPTNQPRLL